MSMRIFLAVIAVFYFSKSNSQYQNSQIFAHNDYAQPEPFSTAHKLGVGYIEADVFLVGDELLVAHHRSEIVHGRTLTALYLEPLSKQVAENGGSAYKDQKSELTLMIDLKTEGTATLNKLVERLEAYPALLACPTLHFMISGNVPPPEEWSNYPSFILIDGRPAIHYTPEQLQRVAMISTSFREHVQWDGYGALRGDALLKVEQLIDDVHAKGKKIRFWATPDFENAWTEQMKLKFDVIVTDDVPGLAAFIAARVPIPTIAGRWRTIAKNPDLGKYNSPKQQPVDFGVWQAKDGTWQLWSCIRGSHFPGTSYTTRFFYGWEGTSLSSPHWEPQGIKWVADSTLGETPGGMQAPFVLVEGGKYYLFYGDWNRICLAQSSDGKNFTRVLNQHGQPNLFTEYEDVSYGRNARDPMVIKRGNTFYCYYTAHLRDPGEDGAAFCRLSFDLREWSESSMAARSAPYRENSQRFSDECPFVVYLPEHKMFYLFVTQLYGKNNQTTVYASANPMYFGVNDSTRKVCTLPVSAPEIVYHEGKFYLFALNPELDGIRMAELEWR